MVHRVFAVASGAALNLDIGGLGCLSTSTFLQWVIGLLIPVVAVAMLLLAALGAVAVSVLRLKVRPPDACCIVHGYWHCS